MISVRDLWQNCLIGECQCWQETYNSGPPIPTTICGIHRIRCKDLQENAYKGFVSRILICVAAKSSALIQKPSNGCWHLYLSCRLWTCLDSQRGPEKCHFCKLIFDISMLQKMGTIRLTFKIYIVFSVNLWPAYIRRSVLPLRIVSLARPRPEVWDHDRKS